MTAPTPPAVDCDMDKVAKTLLDEKLPNRMCAARWDGAEPIDEIEDLKLWLRNPALHAAISALLAEAEQRYAQAEDSDLLRTVKACLRVEYNKCSREYLSFVADLLGTQHSIIIELRAALSAAEQQRQRDAQLHKVNLATMQEQRRRFDRYDKSHTELDSAIADTAAAIRALEEPKYEAEE